MNRNDTKDRNSAGTDEK